MIMSVVRMSWSNIRQDRIVLLLGYLVPLAFFSIYAGIAVLSRNSPPPGPAAARVLAVVDGDRSDTSRRFILHLWSQPGLVVREEAAARQPYDRDTAAAAMRDGQVGAVLAIPPGFGAAPLDFLPGGVPAQLDLVVDPSDPLAIPAYGGMVQQAALALTPDVLLGSGPQSVEGWTGGLTPDQRRRLAARFEGDGRAPGVPVQARQAVTVSVGVAHAAAPDPTVAFYAAAMGVMTILFTATGAATSLVEESETGILARVLSSRMSMFQLLSGKLLFTAAFCLSQLAAIFVWAMLLFHLDLLSHLGGWLLISVPTAFAAAAFSLAIAAFCRTRARNFAMSGLIVLAMGALGGSMFPRFLMPGILQSLGLVTFNAWALDGFTKVFWQQAPSVLLWPQVLALAAFAVLFFLVALRLARRWDLA